MVAVLPSFVFLTLLRRRSSSESSLHGWVGLWLVFGWGGGGVWLLVSDDYGWFMVGDDYGWFMVGGGGEVKLVGLWLDRI